MPFTTILLGRKHTVNIGVALFFYAYSSMIFNRHSVFLGESIMPHVLLIGYILLVIFVAQIIEYQNKTKVKLAELEKKQKKDNELMRALSLDLASCAGDEIVPIMTEKIRAYTEAPLVLFAIFNNKKRTIKLQHVSAGQYIVDNISSITGRDIMGVDLSVGDESFGKFVNNMVVVTSSLAAASSGFVSEAHAELITQKTGIVNYIVLIHKMPGQIFGTTIIGLIEGQKIPNDHILKSFTYVS